jgi:hypothetical protein
MCRDRISRLGELGDNDVIIHVRQKRMPHGMGPDLPALFYESLQVIPAERLELMSRFGSRPILDSRPLERLTGVDEARHNEDRRGEAELIEDRLRAKRRCVAVVERDDDGPSRKLALEPASFAIQEGETHATTSPNELQLSPQHVRRDG